MVSVSFFAVALFASIAFVSASPAPNAVNINSGHIGTGDLDINNVANEALQIKRLSVTSKIFFFIKTILYNILTCHLNRKS
jgi:hypothetical protein